MEPVRKAAASDLPGVAALEQSLFSGSAGEELLTRLLSDGRHELLVLPEGERLTGFAWYEFVLDEGYVGDLAVAEPWRRQGRGRALAEALTESARARGLAFLTLEVRESNLPARRLYQACGFQTVGRRRRYYEKPAEDAVLMTFFFDEAETC